MPRKKMIEEVLASLASSCRSSLDTDRVSRLTPAPSRSERPCRLCKCRGCYACQPGQPCADSCELCGGSGIVRCAYCDGTGLETFEEAV